MEGLPLAGSVRTLSGTVLSAEQGPQLLGCPAAVCHDQGW